MEVQLNGVVHPRKTPSAHRQTPAHIQNNWGPMHAHKIYRQTVPTLYMNEYSQCFEVSEVQKKLQYCKVKMAARVAVKGGYGARRRMKLQYAPPPLLIWRLEWHH